jgi:hypothetical protein
MLPPSISVKQDRKRSQEPNIERKLYSEGMTATIPAPTRTNNKVTGTFYPLQKEELIALKKSRLINNAAYVHLALRMSNPFCDRPIELIPKEFAMMWGIPESSVYEAIGKLKQKKIVDVKTGKVTLTWVNDEERENSQDLEPLANFRTNSEVPEPIMESQNELPNPVNISEGSENQEPEPPSDKDCSSSQTIQIDQIPQTEAVEEDKFSILETEDETPQPMSSISKVLNEFQSADREQPQKNQEIPSEIIHKLKQLNIPLDERVQKAISQYHLSQVLGALDHVKNTWETINDPKKIFLYQLPKQKVEQLGMRGKLYSAVDADGYSLERIKKMYPVSWREAARHFGVAIDE